MCPRGSHTAARGEFSPGVVQGHRPQRGSSPHASGSGEPAETFPACFLLAPPPGHPSAARVPRVPPDCQRSWQIPTLCAQPPSLPTFLPAGEGREGDGVKRSGNAGRAEEAVAGHLPRALTLPVQGEASPERCLLPHSTLWMKNLGWHMQWALLPSELSTHGSHLRNDSCPHMDGPSKRP